MRVLQMYRVFRANKVFRDCPVLKVRLVQMGYRGLWVRRVRWVLKGYKVRRVRWVRLVQMDYRGLWVRRVRPAHKGYRDRRVLMAYRAHRVFRANKVFRDCPGLKDRLVQMGCRGLWVRRVRWVRQDRLV
jgi:hypothetical protein